MLASERYEFWLDHDDVDELDKERLRALTEEEISELFSYDLAFGTGGMRGVMALGAERINKYTVAKASIGIAKYLLTKVEEPSAVIGYDSRNNSSEFAKICADCFSSLGIKVYLFNELRPTPEISFATRKLGASCGVMITASHNPKEYNGYKVYWSDGCQITPPIDAEMIAYVQAEKCMKARGAQEKLISYLGEDMDEAYIKAVKEQSVKVWGDKVRVVYSPLNGTGGTLITKLLEDMGYEVFVVEEQIEPDSMFPTVPKPNPENTQVYELGLKLARKVDADLVITTDPDADRMGCFCRVKKGEYYRLTGNVSGAVIGCYLIENKAESLKKAGKRPVIIKTIVTSKLIEKIADSHELEVLNVLTGFKYIGKLMDEVDFLYGMEESYGCLSGDYARDKDAVLAAMLITEVMGYLKTKGSTMYDYVQDMYEKFGYVCDGILNVAFPSNEGKETMEKILTEFRARDISRYLGFDIVKRTDYLLEETGLPKSDVLFYELDFGWFCIRRSGTEPKMKIYMEADNDENLKELESKLNDLLEKMRADIETQI